MDFEKNHGFTLEKALRKNLWECTKTSLQKYGRCPWAYVLHEQALVLLGSSSLKTGFALCSQLTQGLLLCLEWGACAIGPVGWSGGTCVLAELHISLWPLQFPSVQQQCWFEVSREQSLDPIMVIRSECLTCICVVQVTSRWGQNKFGLFLLLSFFFFFHVSEFLQAPRAWNQLRALRIALPVYFLRYP